jgi:small subunit ribosomal protein S9
MKTEDKFRVSVVVKGGGLQGQAEAVRHGLARALILFNPDFRKRLKKAGFLKRDPRMRERKKFGLKRARRAPQWRKR